ncbi:MAG TPA: hypothetical protein VFP47_16640 [Pyrinomonadaceae bacterium]|jgi:hypothetical protein|nr:hypothetical protein [Pyrinomonadaceae bacterium]HET9788769.1 hypothetical protein [Pyrinomonadaceae bacterium]
MSKIKATLAATLLTVVLTVPALAGNIGSPGATPPPPPPPAIEETTGLPGGLDSGNLCSPELINLLFTVLSFI